MGQGFNSNNNGDEHETDSNCENQRLTEPADAADATNTGIDTDRGSNVKRNTRKNGLKTVSVEHSIKRLLGLPIPECNTVDVVAMPTQEDTMEASKEHGALPRAQPWSA